LILYRTDPSRPFCISDNPVALSNSINPGDSVKGTIGLAVEGIEIYLPIGSELTVAYICQSVGEQYRYVSKQLHQIGGLLSEPAYTYLQSRDTGKALRLSLENVRYQNSLQVLNAERFVMSSVNDFEDAGQMVKDHSSAKVGRRATVN
jgi:hypothetical protein